jgi:hypothetical protein
MLIPRGIKGLSLGFQPGFNPGHRQANDQPCLSAVVSGIWDEGGKGGKQSVVSYPGAELNLEQIACRPFRANPWFGFTWG